jgi:predicted branched-subunit amino acid permease
MTIHNQPQPEPEYWSLAGFIAGVKAMLVVQPSIIAFGLVSGALAAQKGFSAIEALAMSGIVYAGMSQLVALQLWPAQLTWDAIASLALVTLTVNIRFILLNASMRPWFGKLPAWQSHPMLAINTDVGWIVSMRYHERGGRDPAFFLGGAVLTWIVWVAVTLPGYWLGSLITSPQKFGVDMVMPAFFTAMLVTGWRGPRRAAPWAVAGAAALAVDWLGGGWWYIVAGAAAGGVVGGLLDAE